MLVMKTSKLLKERQRKWKSLQEEVNFEIMKGAKGPSGLKDSFENVCIVMTLQIYVANENYTLILKYK